MVKAIRGMDLAVVAAGVGLKVELANIGASIAVIAQVVRQYGRIFRDADSPYALCRGSMDTDR